MIIVMTSLIPIRKTRHTISTRFNAGTKSRDIISIMMKSVDMIIKMGKSCELNRETRR